MMFIVVIDVLDIICTYLLLFVVYNRYLPIIFMMEIIKLIKTLKCDRSYTNLFAYLSKAFS